MQKCLTNFQKEAGKANRKQKKIAAIASSVAVIAGMTGIIAVAFLHDDGKVSSTTSAVTAPSDNSSESGDSEGIKENIEIHLSHDYPELSDDIFVTLDELAQNKETYINNILNGTYDNLKFPEQIDFDVPEEIGRYQIKCLADYYIDDIPHLDKAIRYLMGDAYDEKIHN